MERNHTMIQFFEWHLPADQNHWNRLKEVAPELKEAGIDAVWIPPVTKASSPDDNGYSVYDVYDLGEFEQKESTATKYGTKEQLHEAIQACHDHGISVYVDIVMNHKAGADETETFQVIEVDADNRTNEISEPFDIEGWTKFTFNGRNNKYSDFQWNFTHFNGTDYDAKEDRSGIFKILGENKKWNEEVDQEFGNYDYLMYANIDYDHPDVKGEMISWGKWLAETLNCDGYRLDAIKHINYNFIKEFVSEVADEQGEDFYFIGEFWHPDLRTAADFLDHVEHGIDIFDVPLHYKLYEASQKGRDFDLQTVFDDTLVQIHPLDVVTFVDNHDSQPNESLESWIEDWFKELAYALILLRKDGYPCIFYGDFFGISGDNPMDAKKDMLTKLLSVRYHKAYGDQDDYFDHPNTIGWVRHGDPSIEGSGCAVILSNGDEGDKQMFVGKEHAGSTWIDMLEKRDDQVTIDENGYGCFTVNSQSVSVWIKQ
ncbi:alpha-amylase [Priestia flexa]|uniref:alpha-amylase n=1 Tax=Priestia flexa TaxID=86664 RepID=UPI003D2E836B